MHVYKWKKHSKFTNLSLDFQVWCVHGLHVDQTRQSHFDSLHTLDQLLSQWICYPTAPKPEDKNQHSSFIIHKSLYKKLVHSIKAQISWISETILLNTAMHIFSKILIQGNIICLFSVNACAIWYEYSNTFYDTL